MPPTNIHLIRHAQGYHNLSPTGHTIRDPLLTLTGEQQCHTLSLQIPNLHSMTCIFSSPLRRTLYTALLTFKEVIHSNPELKIIALAELQETSSLPCDIGVELDELRREFRSCQSVDFECVNGKWNDKFDGPYAPRVDLISRRAEKVRRILYAREEKEVAVVTHGAFLHFLTEDWVGSLDGCGTGWANCEIRTYAFDGDMALVETESSLARRRYIYRPSTPELQLELRLATQEVWAAEGYIILADLGEREENEAGEQLEGRTNSEVMHENSM